jgi:hypothetical protein
MSVKAGTDMLGKFVVDGVLRCFWRRSGCEMVEMCAGGRREKK